MSSAPIRDPFADHLITPQNSALVLIDYQPSQFASVRSMDSGLLLKNIVSTVKTARAFNLPIVHSTVNVGGTSVEAQRAGLQRVVQAGCQPISWASLACELQRDWARLETVADIVQIVLTDRLLQ
jgi:nicotinamidase-related amidase